MIKGYLARGLVVLAAILSAGVSFSAAEAASGLVNGGFEMAGAYGSTNLGPGWSYIQTQFTFDTDHLTVNPKGVSCYSAKKCAYITAGEGQNETGSIIQTVKLAAGTYNLKLSGWGWQYDSDLMNNDAWVRGDIYTEPSNHIVGDSTNIGGVYADAKTGPCNGTCWVHMTDAFNNVPVTGGISLIVTQRVNGYGSTGHGSAMSDGWTLNIKKVN